MVKSMVRSMVFSETTTQVMIALDSTAAAYYVISSPINPAGNIIFDFEFAATTLGTDQTIVSGDTHETDEIVIDITAAGALQLYAYVGGVLQTAITVAGVDDGEYHAGKFTYTGTTAELILDTVSAGTQTWALDGSQGFKRYGIRADLSNEANCIIANAKINDIAAGVTTTFKLNKLTGNTENSVEGNNTVTYTNIATTGYIRDTYTLIDDGVNWIGSEVWTDGDAVSNGTEGIFALVGGPLFTLTVGKSYEYTVTVSNFTAGEMLLQLGSASTTFDTDGTFKG